MKGLILLAMLGGLGEREMPEPYRLYFKVPDFKTSMKHTIRIPISIINDRSEKDIL